MLGLSIVTTASGGYGKYFPDWVQGILSQTLRPAEICIVTHGNVADRERAVEAARRLEAAGHIVRRMHHAEQLNLGTARNAAVAISSSEWVMHADVDDILFPHCLETVAPLMPSCEIVALGFEARKLTADGTLLRTRLYRDMPNGAALLASGAPCSGLSPFRRRLWEAVPYRTDMLGAWDTALWVGFAHHFGAALRTLATRRPCFVYRQHSDSVFNRRKKIRDWTHAHVTTSLRSLRRNETGVSVIVPRLSREQPERERIWAHVRRYYARHFPDWQVVEGVSALQPWCKGDAIEKGLASARGRVLVLADADCLPDPVALEAMVRSVESGTAAWAMPHTEVHRLTPAVTAGILAGAAPEIEELERPAYRGILGGGIVVVRRIDYIATGGIPKTFRGWGCEDQALGTILTQLVGPVTRRPEPLRHLWHPPQDRKQGRRDNIRALRLIRHASALGAEALYRYLTNGHDQGPIVEPTWKKKARVAQEQRLAEAKASGQPLRSQEPLWRRRAREAKERRQAEREARKRGE
jgi:glycosyltransferase involved in cell wall biosynthesis